MSGVSGLRVVAEASFWGVAPWAFDTTVVRHAVLLASLFLSAYIV